MKILKVMSWIYLSLFVLSVSTLIIVSAMGGSDYVPAFFKGFYQYQTGGITTSLTADQIAYILGTQFLTILSLFSLFTFLNKKSNSFRKITLIILVLIILNSFSYKTFPLFPIVLVFLLLGKSVRSQLK